MYICLFHSFIPQENMEKLPSINKNDLKLIKMSVSKNYSWSPGGPVKLIKQISLSTQALLKRVFIWLWWPKVPPHLHQPKVQMNEVYIPLRILLSASQS